MSLRLKMLQRSLPDWVKVRMLDRLASVTADGFGVAKPHWLGRSFAARLAEYAEFTALQASHCLSAADASHVGAVRARLCLGATTMGRRLRKTMGVRSREDAFTALRLLYSGIGIDLDARPTGAVTVKHCFFADYYSPGVCWVVEALDQGLADGLFAGASLRFSQRITEGRPSCRGTLRLWMAPPVAQPVSVESTLALDGTLAASDLKAAFATLTTGDAERAA